MNEAIQVIEEGIPNMRHSAEFAQICSALVEALPKIEAASKDSENPHLHNKYADLSSIMDVAKGPLAEHGIVIMQPPAVTSGNLVTVATVLLHKSAQWMACDIALTAGDSRPQTVGSAITYARRYGLSGLLGITAEDDDGNAASGVNKPRNTTAQQKELADRRISEEQARAKPSTAPATAPPTTAKTGKFEMLKQFSSIKLDLKKVTLDDKLYYQILGAHGVEHADQIKTVEEAREIYKQMKQAFADAYDRATNAA